MSLYQRNKRIQKLENQSTSKDADIIISAWTKSQKEQQEICNQQDVNIAPIKWEESDHE